MKAKMILAAMILFCLAGWLPAQAQQKVIIRENFATLDRWEPLTFPKIKKHSTYTLVKEGGKSILKAQSSSSASALVYRGTFNPFEYPVLSWRWKVIRMTDRGNPKEKSGDDYPIRVYVMFQYDPVRASLGDRLLYNAAKAFYGKYPPHSTLNYVWTGTGISDKYILSPYTDKVRMVVLERGKDHAGQWIEESVNILDDYRKVFGHEPPAVAGLAVMSDSDNTGTEAEAYLDFIEVSR